MSQSPYASLGDALRLQADQLGEWTALSFPQTGHAFSYAKWYREALRIAHGLQALGISPGDHVALLAQNRIEWPVVQFAVALAGCVFVPINTHLRRDDLAYVLAHCEARVLFLSGRFRSQSYLATVRQLRNKLPDLRHLIALDRAEGECLDYRELELSHGDLPTLTKDHVAALLYTSGTTGFPKGALLSHGALLFDGWQIAKRLHLSVNDRWTSIIPLFHCAGCIMNIVGTLQAGARYVGIEAFDPVTMFQTIQGEQCTVLSGVPTSYRAMLDHPERQYYDLGSLRTGSCGGADANPDLLRRCARDYPIPQLCNVYGQTESATIIACPDCEDDERFDTVGPPLDGCEVRITEPTTGECVTDGEIGQIEARGVLVMLGYFRNTEASAETVDENGWLKTGDLGRLTVTGKLQLTGGRLRDMIIRGGENIYPVEIENCLMEHEAVNQVAVFAIPDEYYGEVVGAGVSLEDETTAQTLAALCKERMAGFKVPVVWYRIDEFPLTASGKIRKVELQRLAVAGELESFD